MRNLTQALTLTSMTTAVRSAFKIASVNPVLWWDAESHRAGLAGGMPTLFQDSGGTSAVSAVEQPVGRAVDQSGNARHALQATSTARPILTARKNLLSFSEQFDNAAWSKGGCAATGGIVSETAGNGQHRIQQIIAVTPGAVYSISCEVERISGSRHFMLDISSGTNGYCYFDLGNGTHFLAGAGMSNVSVVSVGAGKYKISANFTASAASMVLYVAICALKAMAGETYTADGSGVLSVAKLQVESGPAATSYQRVAAANDYDTTAAPLMMRFDGVDDSLASSAIATGTLPSSADAWLVFTPAADEQDAVFVDDPSSAGVRYFGTRAPGQSASQRQDGATTANASFTLNGALIAGTVDPTRQQLYSATSGGAPVLLQVTNLNLSSWLGVRLGAYAGSGSGYGFKGRHGALLITPAQSDATRAKIRKALAKAYQIQGVV